MLTPSEPVEADCSQRDIPALVRYELAYECYLRLQRPDEALAWLCLRASWVARDQHAIIPPTGRVERMAAYVSRWLPPDAPDANLADRELAMCTVLAAAVAEGHFNTYQCPYAELVLAMFLRRHGENAPAERLLSRLLEDGALPDELANAARRMRDSIEIERRWQRLALRHLTRAVHMRAIATSNEGVALYLLGELHRRLGDPGQSVEHFDLALNHPDLPPDLCDWATVQRDRARASR